MGINNESKLADLQEKSPGIFLGGDRMPHGSEKRESLFTSCKSIEVSSPYQVFGSPELSTDLSRIQYE